MMFWLRSNNWQKVGRPSLRNISTGMTLLLRCRSFSHSSIILRVNWWSNLKLLGWFPCRFMWPRNETKHWHKGESLGTRLHFRSHRTDVAKILLLQSNYMMQFNDAVQKMVHIYIYVTVLKKKRFSSCIYCLMHSLRTHLIYSNGRLA